jgi:hemerythrin-like domain-containing protein
MFAALGTLRMGAHPESIDDLEETTMSTSNSMADSRDMIVVHTMFRRQFAGIPALVSEVRDGDTDQVAIVADHVAWMVEFLHAHHEGEDMLVWPRLVERCPTEVEPLIFTMEAQHHGLAVALDDLAAKAATWRTTSAVQERDALAEAATELLVPIAEHLDLEEREVLSLIDAYLTEKEWKQVGGSGLKKMSFGQLTVAFGMILDDASPEQVTTMRHTIPRGPWLLFSLLGPRAYSKYAERLHGDSRSAHRTAA